MIERTSDVRGSSQRGGVLQVSIARPVGTTESACGQRGPECEAQSERRWVGGRTDGACENTLYSCARYSSSSRIDATLPHLRRRGRG